MVPETLYNFICRDENFKTLNKLKKLKFHQVNEIVRLFIEDESSSLQQQQFDILKDYLIKHAKSYQLIYGNLFPRYFARIDDYGIQSKTEFNVHYKNYLTQKIIFEWQQKSLLLTSIDSIDENNENISANTTPLNMTKLNEEEEKKEDIDFKKEVIDDVTVFTFAEKIEKKKEKQKKGVQEKINKEEKKKKKKINAEKKRQKRNEQKRKLEGKLIENTQKLQKIKKVNK